MLKERFIKIEGSTYFESELRLMSDDQLRELISDCQTGITDISRKMEDYRTTNINTDDPEHYEDVLKRFESASVYLQSDIVLLSNILKERKFKSNAVDYSEWYKVFFEVTKNSVLKGKLKKLMNDTNKITGINMEIK